MRRTLCRVGRGTILLTALVVGAAAHAQQQPAPQQASPQQSTPGEQPPPSVPGAVSVQRGTPQGPTTCLQPPPLVGWQDYEGPFAKVVGAFGRKLERKEVSTNPGQYRSGTTFCTLNPKGKFMLFVNDTIDPITFLSAAFYSGISQAENDDPSYGQGASGYGKRVGFNLIDQAQSNFFGDFAYPVIFSEDPRYYRLGSGSFHRRLLHAVEHSAIAYNVNGSKMPNFSLWFATTSSTALSNVYHPDHQRGFAPTAESVGESIGQDIGFDVLREFWPEIARKFKLPFRGETPPADQDANPAQP
ncbi:MAG TPA: hypothetical protein VHX36_11300 [Candidatus Acidoferrales bacterium]|nr:hypothetical protein [Candidatus Acidoferrales bacterium]